MSFSMSEMVKLTGKAGIGMITGLVNQVMVEGVIPAKRELSNIVKCYMGKALEIGNYRGQNLAY